MPTALTLEGWRSYCRGAVLADKSSLDALRLAVPEFYALLADTTRRFGISFDSAGDAGCGDETRIPLQQAVHWVLQAACSTDQAQSRAQLETAIQWLESPHPMQTGGVQQKILSLLEEIRGCFHDPAALTLLAGRLQGEA